MSEYIVLLMGDADAWWDTSEEEKQASYGVHERFTAELAERGHTITGGAELHRATQARSIAPNADTVTEGPWAETTEQLGGFYQVVSDDLDDLMEVCKQLAATGDAVEVHRTVTDEERAS